MECKMKKTKIALICFDNPFLPPMEGGKRAMLTKIRSLMVDPDKYEVDIYLHNKRNEGSAVGFKGVEKQAHGIYQFQMNSTLKSIWGMFPICVNKRFSRECAALLKKNDYDVAIYEGAQVSKYRLKNVVNAKYHIIYLHDIESAYRSDVARSQKKLHMRAVNFLEAQRFQWVEKQIKDKFHRVWFISKEECETFGRWMCKREICRYLPFPAMELAQKPVEGQKAPQMLYVGDLSIEHNYRSVEWFASSVLPLIMRKCPQAELRIVGRISDERADVLRKHGAVVCGYVDDLDAAYEEAACIVAPVLFGAGVKVKTIDALARGQIVITTAKGVEGTELCNDKHLIVEDDPVKLAERCYSVLTNRERYLPLAEAGLGFIKQVHTIEHQAELIDCEIEMLMQ